MKKNIKLPVSEGMSTSGGPEDSSTTGFGTGDNSATSSERRRKRSEFKNDSEWMKYVRTLRGKNLHLFKKGMKPPHHSTGPLGTVWGNMRTNPAKERFKKWLNTLKNADPILKSPTTIKWWKGLPTICQKRIKAKLKDLDPGWTKRLGGKQGSATQARNRRKNFLPKEEMKHTQVLIETAAKLDVPDAHIVRFVDADGIKGLLALCLASGYSKVEVAKMVHLEISDIDGLVTMEDIQKARRRMPMAVVEAAEQKVMRDLLGGVVSEETSRADLIVSRRRKLMIEAHAEGRQSQDTDEDRVAREKKLSDRFGVDRSKGEIIDVKEEKQ